MQRMKKREESKIKIRQQIKKGRSKRSCRRQYMWLIITLLSHRYRSAITPLSLCCRSSVTLISHHYRSAVAPPLSLRRCRFVVSLLSHRYHTGIAPLSLRCCRSCCRYAVAPLSHRYRTAITPLSLCCCCSCCCYAVAPLSLRCCAVVKPLLFRPREVIKNSKLNCC